MTDRLPLSDAARAAGHRLYQALYGPISEGFKLTIDEVQTAIDRLVLPNVSDDDLVRAAMAEANFRRSQACDDDSAQTAEYAVAEPCGRMLSNTDVVGLLQDAQMARHAAQSAEWDAQIARWDAEETARLASQ